MGRIARPKRWPHVQLQWRLSKGFPKYSKTMHIFIFNTDCHSKRFLPLKPKLHVRFHVEPFTIVGVTH